MKTILQKHQIVESLKTLDQAQTEKVLNYIKGLTLKVAVEESWEDRVKREGMLQIRQALRNARTINAF